MSDHRWTGPVYRGAAGISAVHFVAVALATFLAGCGDITTAPVAGPPVEPGFVVVSRTMDIAARDGLAAVRRTSRDTLMGQVRAAPKGRLVLSSADAPPAGFDPANLPLPPLSLPARYETAICRSLPAYSRSMPAPGDRGAVEMSGTGDAPPSTLKVVRDGRHVGTIERTWVRTADSWQLERQVTTAADGGYRDVVTYEHRTARGQIAANAIAVSTCVAPLLTQDAPSARASRGYYAPRLKLPGAGSKFIGSTCTSDDDYGIDPCFEQRMNLYRADAALVVASGGAAFACIFPQPLHPPACVVAAATYFAAVANLKLAKMSLDNCRAEAAAKKCSCQNATVQTPSATGGLSASLSADCSGDWYDDGYQPTPVIGPGSESGSSGAGGGDCAWEVWEISYDGGWTWGYYGTFRVCYNVI